MKNKNVGMVHHKYSTKETCWCSTTGKIQAAALHNLPMLKYYDSLLVNKPGRQYLLFEPQTTAGLRSLELELC